MYHHTHNTATKPTHTKTMKITFSDPINFVLTCILDCLLLQSLTLLRHFLKLQLTYSRRITEYQLNNVANVYTWNETNSEQTTTTNYNLYSIKATFYTHLFEYKNINHNQKQNEVYGHTLMQGKCQSCG